MLASCSMISTEDDSATNAAASIDATKPISVKRVQWKESRSYRWPITYLSELMVDSSALAED